MKLFRAAIGTWILFDICRHLPCWHLVQVQSGEYEGVHWGSTCCARPASQEELKLPVAGAAALLAKATQTSCGARRLGHSPARCAPPDPPAHGEARRITSGEQKASAPHLPPLQSWPGWDLHHGAASARTRPCCPRMLPSAALSTRNGLHAQPARGNHLHREPNTRQSVA